MKPTAIGAHIAIIPPLGSIRRWVVALINGRGRCWATSEHASEAEARAEARRLRRHHRKLAEARGRKR